MHVRSSQAVRLSPVAHTHMRIHVAVASPLRPTASALCTQLPPPALQKGSLQAAIYRAMDGERCTSEQAAAVLLLALSPVTIITHWLQYL